jgi:drug/metabolite transporter (DMT)-like permease
LSASIITTLSPTPRPVIISDDRPHHPLQGVMLMLAAVACFAALDSTTKLVTVAVPMLVAVWFRYAFQAVVTVITLWPSQRQRLFETQRPGLHLMRGLMLVGTSALAFLSLKVVSVGEFTAIVMLSPIVMSVVSAWRLKQNPGTVGWVCVLGGFVGVLIVMRPGSSLFGWASLLPLGLVATNSAYQLLTSELGKTDDLGTMHFYSGFIGAVLPAVALPWVWQPIENAHTWGLLVLLGVFSSAGHLLLSKAYQKAPVVQLTPFLYAQIGFAVLAGWLVFNHVPDAWSLTGIGLIALCGAGSAWFRASRR